MNCDQARTEMIAYLKNELDESSKKRFEEHIALCPNCRHEMEGARRLLSWTEAASQEAVGEKVRELIVNAVAAGASDIHFEPQRDNELLVRYRIDGVMQEVDRIDSTRRHGVVTRIKMMAEMSVPETRVPLDGIFKLSHNDKDYSIRVSSVPFVFGESLAMKILDQSSVFLGLDKLYFSEEHLTEIRDLLSQPCGMIVATGPTGSGKTTTQYSMLLEINSPARKIMTIEDPVECMLNGVNHAQVNVKTGFTFAAALRSFFRHDPDVIMVGETRDLETEELALRAAITGHLVLSTLHTDDAVGAITRLTDMGVEPYLIGASLLGVISQRLVRRVCQNCKEEASLNKSYPLPGRQGSALGFLGITPEEAVAGTIVRGKGCEACRQTGYKGRMGVYEVLTIDRDIAAMVGNGATPSEILAAAKAQGFKTMREDAKAKVLAGLTTPEEAMRVLV